MAEDSKDQLAKEILGDKPAAAGAKGSPMFLIIAAVVVVIAGGAGGYLAGSLLRKAPGPQKAHAEESAAATSSEDEGGSHSESEYFEEFEPFTVTLETPRRDRFLVATVILAFDKADMKVVMEMLEKKKRELRSKITLYLNSRTLEDVSGTKNLNRILRELQDMINEYLWPNQKPLVTLVLFKNLAIQ